MRTPLTVLASAVGALALALMPALGAQAATGNVVGIDVSWPQCGTVLPTTAHFGVVGVNDGLANTSNPCFADQLSWATHLSAPVGSSQPVAQLYVNTANPGKQGKWWPTTDRTQAGTLVAVPDQYGACTGKVTAGCAYVYGWSMAEQDVTKRGVTNPSGYRWWLDVETSNTWSRDTTANRADLEAMVTRIRQSGGTVGIYSTSYQFGRIAGALPSGSPLAGLPTWLAGASGKADAVQRCSGPSFTGGTNALVQWVESNLDRNVSCTD